MSTCASHTTSAGLHTGPGVQKAKGQPILRLVAGPASRVFKFASIDARETFINLVNPLKEAQSAQQPSVVPDKVLKDKVFAAYKDVAALYQRHAPAQWHYFTPAAWHTAAGLCSASPGKSASHRKHG